jgi:hypothetical protein
LGNKKEAIEQMLLAGINEVVKGIKKKKVRGRLPRAQEEDIANAVASHLGIE